MNDSRIIIIIPAPKRKAQTHTVSDRMMEQLVRLKALQTDRRLDCTSAVRDLLIGGDETTAAEYAGANALDPARKLRRRPSWRQWLRAWLYWWRHERR